MSDSTSPAPVVIVMGVSGCGKTTVGTLLAKRLNVPFLDADDFHPPENIAKMQSGQPLQDVDRKPWLDVLSQLLQTHQTHGVVLACSALRQRYREHLSTGVAHARFIYLKGNFDEIYSRMKLRDHFMPASLLKSQFSTLEEPEDAIVLDLSQDVQTLVDTAYRSLCKSD